MTDSAKSEPMAPEKMDGTSLDVAEQRRRELKQLFPGVFTETTGADGQPIPYQERRSYTGGVLYMQQQYEAPLNGGERVRVLVATDEARKSIPIKMERVRLPW